MLRGHEVRDGVVRPKLQNLRAHARKANRFSSCGSTLSSHEGKGEGSVGQGVAAHLHACHATKHR